MRVFPAKVTTEYWWSTWWFPIPLAVTLRQARRLPHVEKQERMWLTFCRRRCACGCKRGVLLAWPSRPGTRSWGRSAQRSGRRCRTGRVEGTRESRWRTRGALLLLPVGERPGRCGGWSSFGSRRNGSATVRARELVEASGGGGAERGGRRVERRATGGWPRGGGPSDLDCGLISK